MDGRSGAANEGEMSKKGLLGWNVVLYTAAGTAGVGEARGQPTAVPPPAVQPVHGGLCNHAHTETEHERSQELTNLEFKFT